MRPLIFTFAALAITAPAAGAQTFVYGSGEAYACYKFADSPNLGSPPAIKTCQNALETMEPSPKNRVATYVNLGVLQTRAGDYDAALIAFDTAAKLKPDMAEIYLNKGACLIYMNRSAEAVEALEKSLELGTPKELEARYNRALALESLERYREAYADLQRVLELRPDWDRALETLSRYSVISKPAG